MDKASDDRRDGVAEVVISGSASAKGVREEVPSRAGRRDATMRRERVGRTNAERRQAAGVASPAEGRDRSGDGSERLDDLQGRFDATAARPGIELAEVDRDEPERTDPAPRHTAKPDEALWNKLATLTGQTLRTAKGEPFRVSAVQRDDGVTVVPLDGGQRWTIDAADLETGIELVEAGMVLDRLAPIRLQEAGVGARHPEVVAGILRAVGASRSRGRQQAR